MRRISTGVVGGPILGVMSSNTNTLTTLTTNSDLEIDPNGTGIVRTKSHHSIDDNQSLQLQNSGNTQNVSIKSPGALTASYTITLPSTGGTNNYVLKTDGSGGLDWVEVALNVSNQTVSGTTHYPVITTVTNGPTTQTVNVSSSKLSFVPSTGTLSATALSTGNLTATGTSQLTTVDINGGNIDATTIGGASAAAGTFTTMTASTITETSSITYKENVNPIDSALDKVLQLVGVTYDRKDGSTKNEAGLIAEDTAKILPNLVTYKDGKPEGINYTKLSAYLIEAIKELNNKIK